MTTSNHVIQLAKERALFRLRVASQQLLRIAGEDVLKRLKEVRSADEEHELKEVQRFVQVQGKVFQAKMEEAYRDLLDRAMQTMYTDLRVALDQLSADGLTLIDDDTVMRQIKLDHAVKRMRDADDEHLQRISLIIGRMHGKNDAKERENPFRPYLLARALHQVVSDLAGTRNVSQRLFDLLSDALATLLPDFYRSIREVFESHGLRAQLVAEKSLYAGSLSLHGGVSALPEQTAARMNTRVLPELRRALDGLQLADGPDAAAGSASGPATGFAPGTRGVENFVNGIFNAHGHADGQAASADGAAAPAVGPLRAGSQALLARLDQFQRQAARGEAVSTALAPEQNQLFALNEQIGPDEAGRLERVAIDVVAVLFDLILADEKIDYRFRTLIGRLQIPFLKAALLTPQVLQQASHPARRLVNRMGSAALGLDPASPAGVQVEREIGRIVTRILTGFAGDVGIFAECLREFERFLEAHYRGEDAEAARSVLALEEVEGAVRYGSAGGDGTTRLDVPTWLNDFSIDQRVVDFIANTWVRVLERERELPPGQAGTDAVGGFHDVLPDLIWSVHAKHNAQERADLVRMLPGLVKRLQAGLALLDLSPADMRREMDALVAVHTQVLRGNMAASPRQAPALPELRERLERRKAEDDQESAAGNAYPTPVETGRIASELSRRGVTVDLDLVRDAAPPDDAGVDWLDGVQVGTGIERWGDDGYKTGYLVWISKRRTLYLVKIKGQGMPVVYSRTSLIKSLREGSLRLLEHVPVFERAVESLLHSVRAADQRI